MRDLEEIFPHLRKERDEEIKKVLDFLRPLLKTMERD